MADFSQIRGVLLDVDGVLHVDGEVVPGAGDALRSLEAAGIGFRLLTNGTMMTREKLSIRLADMKIDVPPENILTAVTATADYLRQQYPGEPAYLVISGDIAGEFDGIPLTHDESEARVVVVGGAGDGFDFATLNRAYRMLRHGAALVAMHKSVHWLTADGVTLDSGPYIHGLEWAVGTEATVVGKPSPHFFQAGFDAFDLPPEHIAMVGDDPIQDVAAAMSLGATGILVETGLGTLERRAPTPPDVVLSSVALLPGLLGYESD